SRTTTTAVRRTGDARRCGDRPRRGRTDRRAATRARGPSPRPATPDRHLGLEPRSGGARSDARVDGSSIPQSMIIGRSCRAVPDPTQQVGRARSRSLRSPAVADTASPLTAPIGKQLPTDLSLTPLVDGAAGQARPGVDGLVTLRRVSVILEPYTNQ